MDASSRFSRIGATKLTEAYFLRSAAALPRGAGRADAPLAVQRPARSLPGRAVTAGRMRDPASSSIGFRTIHRSSPSRSIRRSTRRRSTRTFLPARRCREMIAHEVRRRRNGTTRNTFRSCGRWGSAACAGDPFNCRDTGPGSFARPATTCRLRIGQGTVPAMPEKCSAWARRRQP